MKIAILCSDAGHPVNRRLEGWIDKHAGCHDIALVRRQSELEGGDVLFLISCAELVNRETRARFRHALVVHASDLPEGRGWSPHIWAICEGARELTVSILEVEDEVDSGAIWKKLRVPIPKDALWDEINDALFEAELALMEFAVQNADSVVPEPQDPATNATYHSRRTPENSRVDPDCSIASQFDLIRVCDPDRYPAFFDLRGRRYKLMLEALDDE